MLAKIPRIPINIGIHSLWKGRSLKVRLLKFYFKLTCIIVRLIDTQKLHVLLPQVRIGRWLIELRIKFGMTVNYGYWKYAKTLNFTTTERDTAVW